MGVFFPMYVPFLCPDVVVTIQAHTTPQEGSTMIELHNIRYTGRGFEGAVVLPSKTGPLSYHCCVDGPTVIPPKISGVQK